MELVLEAALACLGLWSALALTAALAGGHAWARQLLALARAIGVVFAALSLGLMVWLYRAEHDWVHLLWSSTTPQLALFVGAGAFLVRTPSRRERWPLVLLACLLTLALVPAVLLQLDPRAGTFHRNVGRPIAGTLEVLAFGLGGPWPATLVPENPAGVARGMGYLPREVSVPVGALALFALLATLLGALQLAGSRLRSQRLGDVWHLLAPPLLVPLLLRPLPLGIRESSIWESDPLLMRGLGPLLLIAVLTTIVAAVVRRRASDRERAETARLAQAPAAGSRGANVACQVAPMDASKPVGR